MTISKFCEKQFVLNVTTLIVQKPFFVNEKYKTSLILCLSISLVSVYKISSELMQW